MYIQIFLEGSQYNKPTTAMLWGWAFIINIYYFLPLCSKIHFAFSKHR
jgi:hypothetical protein